MRSSNLRSCRFESGRADQRPPVAQEAEAAGLNPASVSVRVRRGGPCSRSPIQAEAVGREPAYVWVRLPPRAPTWRRGPAATAPRCKRGIPRGGSSPPASTIGRVVKQAKAPRSDRGDSVGSTPTSPTIPMRVRSTAGRRPLKPLIEVRVLDPQPVFVRQASEQRLYDGCQACSTLELRRPRRPSTPSEDPCAHDFGQWCVHALRIEGPLR